jgi:proteasome accessory factor C
MERGEVASRKVDPYHLLFRGGQFYLLGRDHRRKDMRTFRLSRIQGKVAYATKAEHDFKAAAAFDPRGFANSAEWQYGERIGTARVWISDRIAWQVERHFGRFGEIEPADGGIVFETPYANTRQMAAWVLSLAEYARVESPPELVEAVQRRLALLAERHDRDIALAAPAAPEPDAEPASGAAETGNGRRDPAAIRPERFARLVTLASILIDAGRAGDRLRVAELCERLQVSEQELREDVNVLNVVNFGGGSYVIYAEVGDDGWIEVDPEPYSDNFARPARLLPVEAKALLAAIDLIGDHLPEGALDTAREKIVAALGEDPTERGLRIAAADGDDTAIVRAVNEAIAGRRLLRMEYYKPSEDEYSIRTIEPYLVMNNRDGRWYVAAFDPAKDAVRHFRLDRIKHAEVLEERFTLRPEVDLAADIDGWARTGELEDSRTARLWIAPERARWAREEYAVEQDLADGAIVARLPFKGVDWLRRRPRRRQPDRGEAALSDPRIWWRTDEPARPDHHVRRGGPRLPG